MPEGALDYETRRRLALAATEAGAYALAEAFLTARSLAAVRAEMARDSELEGEARALIQEEVADPPVQGAEATPKESPPARPEQPAPTEPSEEQEGVAPPGYTIVKAAPGAEMSTADEPASGSDDPQCLICHTRRSQAGPTCENPIRGAMGCRYTLGGDPIQEAIHRSLAGPTRPNPPPKGKPLSRRGKRKN